MRPRFRAIVWDFVGTVVEPAVPVAQTYALVAREHGMVADPHRIVERFADALRLAPPLCFGRNPAAARREAEQAWWRDVVAHTYGVPTHQLSDAVFAALWQLYGRPAAWRVLPPARRAMLLAQRAGLRNLVLSNNDARLYDLVAGLDLPVKPLDVLASADMAAAKPSAEAFGTALVHLGLPPAQVLAIDDDARNREGARAVGMSVTLDAAHAEKLAGLTP